MSQTATALPHASPEVPPDGEVVAVGAQALATYGRFLVSAGSNHFVSDTRESSGGPGEAIQAGSLLLASLASCGLGLIQRRATELGVTLNEAQADTRFQRDPLDKSRFQWIRLSFRLLGVEPATAHELVAHFTQNCPIYNTLRRGGEVSVQVSTV